MKIYNSTQNNLIADKADVADNFFTRTFGLIPKSSISFDEGLVIKPCCSIHTFFMRFAIDLIFIDRENRVVALYENVVPWRILPIHFNSRYVIELANGCIADKNIKKHDIISLSF